MYTKSLLYSALALLPTAFGVALPGIASENPATILSKRDSFSCEGSSQCSLDNMARYCDIAVNENLRRGTNYYLYRASSPNTLEGTCRGNGLGYGCGVFLEGPDDCTGSGDDLWLGYQQIRDAGCNPCGFKEFTGDNGGVCRLKVDYVTGCADAEPV